MSSQAQERLRAMAQRRAEAVRVVDQLGIDWDSLPKLPFFSWNTEEYRLYVAQSIISGQQLLQRQLSPDERNAVAYHGAKKKVTMTYATPTSIAITLVAMRRGKDVYRFPFWTPKPTNFDPSRFPIPSSKSPFTLLQGAPAMKAWHAGRSVVFPGPAPPEDPSMQDSDAEHTNSQYGGYSMDDESRQGTETYDTATPMSSDYSTPKERQQTRRQQPQPSSPTQNYSPPASDGLESGGIFDEASPVAPAARGRPGTSSSGLSRWDQIRRQAATNSGGSGAAQAGTDDHHGDSFTYSQEDRENATAKEQAQREFDAMLERERRGETGDRWRRS
ncbi:hypothetical protein DL546_009884 [Coniochaeta pulveracea]|uniref:Uncharacterized protein n=1 Tax=Coniochaeta pulveracea TaxID=177199 RepID=A0A420YNF5_9PEZI|nr:hypothetical protein DL546_009884 [Coniochaeta pulveracea]